MGSRVNRSGSFCQDLQNEFVGGKAAESLESFGEVVGSDEVAEVNAQLGDGCRSGNAEQWLL